jgi:AraC-like DNA-binding protein
MVSPFEAGELSDYYSSQVLVPLHHHDYYEMFFFQEGKVRYTVEGRSYRLLTGDILIISPTELHQPVFLQSGAFYRRLVILLSTEYIASLRQISPLMTLCFDREGRERQPLLRFHQTAAGALYSHACEVVAELEAGDELSSLRADCLLRDLLISINRLVLANKAASLIQTESSEGLMEKVVSYINQNIQSKLSLDLLADQMYVSKFHLMRLFRKHMGTTVHRYIIQRRLLLSKRLMLEGIAPSRVYTRCGYTNYSSFYRAFVDVYGESPASFLTRALPVDEEI